MGKTEILEYLEKQNLIFSDLLNEHVDFTQQTIGLNESGLESVLLEVFDTPRLAWQSTFALKSSQLIKDAKKIPKHTLIYMAFAHSIKHTLKSMYRNLLRKEKMSSQIDGENEGNLSSK